jgi:hypothetical protein
VRRAAGGLVLGLVVLAGCSSAPAAAPSSSAASSSAVAALPEVSGITAEAVRLRSDVAIGRQFQVRVTNTGTEPFTVTSAQLDSPGFALMPARQETAQFAPRRVIDLPVDYGAVKCSGQPEPAVAQLTVVRPDGAEEALRVPLAGRTVRELYDSDCAVEAVLAVVDVAVVDLAEADGTMTADVVLIRRRDGDDVVVSDLLASVVLQAVPQVELPARLGARERELRLPVVFDAERCDPHALAEVKQPFVFPLIITVGDGDDVGVDLPLDDDQKLTLQGFLGRVCR